MRIFLVPMVPPACAAGLPAELGAPEVDQRLLQVQSGGEGGVVLQSEMNDFLSMHVFFYKALVQSCRCLFFLQGPCSIARCFSFFDIVS